MKISFEISRGGDVEKAAAVPPGRLPGTIANELSQAQQDQAARLTSDAPAAGEPPQPGPVPIASNQPPGKEPIRWQFPYAINQSVTPRGEDRRLTPYEQLRTLADTSDIIRIATEARKDQLTQLKWDFSPKERSHARKPTDEQLRKIDALRVFFAKPDRHHDWQTWLRMLIEEVLVVDALSIYKRRTKGGGLYGLELIDGTTIKPLLDPRGFTPKPPHIAYRQIIRGQPVAGGDCTIEQLLYRPRTVRTWTPYGLSATECVLLTVNTALNRQLFNLSYYAEGNVPEGVMSTPEGWTTDQIREFQTYWDSLLAGNFKARSRLRFVGPKMAETIKQFKQENFDTKFDEWLLQVICAAFGVQPQELGFTHQVNKAQGEQQENVTYRRGVKPLANFVKAILDEVVAVDLQMPDFESIYSGGETEDKLAQAKIDEIYVKIGKVSIDELRARDGEEQIGLGPMVFTNEGPVFVEQLVKDKDHNPLTSNVRDVNAPKEDLSNQNTDEAAKRKKGEVVDESEPDENDTVKAIDDELRAFRRFVSNRVAKGRNLDRIAGAFESDVLPLHVRESIVQKVFDIAGEANVVRQQHVAQAFELVEKGTAGARIKTRAQSQYRKVTKAYFGELADALSAHMETEIAAVSADQTQKRADTPMTVHITTPPVTVHVDGPHHRPRRTVERIIERDARNLIKKVIETEVIEMTREQLVERDDDHQITKVVERGVEP